MAESDINFRFELQVDGRFRRIFSRRKDIKKIALDNSAAVLLRRNRERFLKAQDPDGKKWPVSRAAIARNDSGKKTLFDTGSLYGAIQVFRARARSNVRFVGVNGAITNRVSGARVIDYANKLNKGEGPFPVRRIMGISREDIRRVNAVVAKIIERELKR